MAIIPQRRLFSWDDVENLGELKRLKLVLAALPDEPFMLHLERDRANGRDDYPIRAVWNSILAGVVFQHPSMESLRRELLRNAQLRQVCGFDPVKDAEKAVPTPSACSRFLDILIEHQDEIDKIFDRLVQCLREELPDFGRFLACDSKGIPTHARPRGREKYEELLEERRREGPDRRRDLDADMGKKTYRGKREDGSRYETVKKWFGYKLHLIVDTEYELPVGYEVTPASRPDNKVFPDLLDGVGESHGELLKAAEAMVGDKGYDDVKILNKLWDGYGIAPIIPKRDDWQGDQTRLLSEDERYITYNCQGRLFCYSPGNGTVRHMVHWGFEPQRDGQKWRCPVAVYDGICQGRSLCCGKSEYGRVVRVPRDYDPRTFTPVARTSLKFERLYRKRPAVERVNSRVDVSFGFERHFIRGQAKMRLRCSLALMVMLAMALGRTREKNRQEGQEDKTAPTVRSLVGAA